MDIEVFISDLLNTKNRLEIVHCVHIKPGPQWFIEPRKHNDSLIYLILEGSCSGYLDDQTCTWSSGDLWWVPPQVAHSFKPDPGPELHMYVLRWSSSLNSWPQQSIRLAQGLACEKTFKQLLDIWHDPAPHRLLRMRAGIAQLCLCISAALEDPTEHAAGLSYEHRQQCYSYAAKHLLHNVQAEDLARICGLQLSYFRRLFKRSFHCNPRSWLARERIKHAASLIRDAGLSVEEAAQACGYASTPTFSRCFKRVMGVNPSSW